MVIGLAFLYFPLRTFLFDSPIWIVFFPFAASAYILLYPRFFLTLSFNRLDRLILAYVVWGTIQFFLGITAGVDSAFMFQMFTHYYLPFSLYFIGRRYFYSLADPARAIERLLVVVALIWVASYATEYYIIVILGKTAGLPWNSFYWSSVEPIVVEIGLHRPLSIFNNFKQAGYVSGFLLIFLFPIVSRFTWANQRRLDLSRITKFIAFIAIISGLFWTVLVTGNKTVVLVIPVAIGIQMFVSRSKALVVFFAIGTMLFILIFFSRFQDLYESASAVSSLGGPTPVERIFDLDPVITALDHMTFQSMVVGSFVAEQETTGLSPGGVYRDIKGSELRIIGFPIFFGFVWSAIILLVLITAGEYALRASKTPRYQILALGTLGVLILFSLDWHYTSFMKHGPLELFIVVISAISSTYSTRRADIANRKLGRRA